MLKNASSIDPNDIMLVCSMEDLPITHVIFLETSDGLVMTMFNNTDEVQAELTAFRNDDTYMFQVCNEKLLGSSDYFQQLYDVVRKKNES
jgi:hypothetical protein